MLTLYRDAFWISPYVFSCFVALEEKGLPYEVKTLSIGDGAHKKPEYANASVTARIPALDHDGFVVAESSAIVEYLEDAFPQKRVLPTDPKERARARQIMAWIRSDDTFAIREERPTHTMFYEHTNKPLSPAGVKAVTKLFDVCDRLLGPGATSMFGVDTVADADLAFMVQRLLMNGGDVPPKARAFAEAQWKRPAIAKFVALPRQPYVPY
jgi:glutathione S-transferase